MFSAHVRRFVRGYQASALVSQNCSNANGEQDAVKGNLKQQRCVGGRFRDAEFGQGIDSERFPNPRSPQSEPFYNFLL